LVLNKEVEELTKGGLLEEMIGQQISDNVEEFESAVEW
jgi:hypothetical protein